jgi:beta-1,4-mannosyl-glycoprotein beta-1,4-N-acetylglucosaminyltransferase
MNKIFDCITFFRENFITNIRFEILHKDVDYFVVCESQYDHRGIKKKFNFKLKNKKFINKIIYLKHKKKFPTNNRWQNQAIQREFIKKGLKIAKPDDIIMFSDPDEIPNPKILKKLELKKDYGIFMQKSFCYKFNLFNPYESPWEGTRIAKFKKLNSIDYMRQKILKKNLKKPFWKFHVNKSIQIFDNGGWHFNSLLTAKEISIKLNTFAHSEFSSEKYINLKVIKKNINTKIDLFNRGWKYKKITFNNKFPKFLLKNKNKFKKWII